MIERSALDAVKGTTPDNHYPLINILLPPSPLCKHSIKRLAGYIALVHALHQNRDHQDCTHNERWSATSGGQKRDGEEAQKPKGKVSMGHVVSLPMKVYIWRQHVA